VFFYSVNNTLISAGLQFFFIIITFYLAAFKTKFVSGIYVKSQKLQYNLSRSIIGRKYNKMKKILKIIGITTGVIVVLFIGLVVAVGIFYNPDVSLSVSSPKEGEEVTEEKVLVEGSYTGAGGKVFVNGLEAGRDTGKLTFSQEVKVDDGETKILVEYKEGDEVKAKKELSVNFDLEGKLYLAKEQDFTKVPQYEIVRKENVDGGFTAIAYADIAIDDPDYLISNVGKDIKQKNPAEHTISIMIFPISIKPEIEKALEDSDQELGLTQLSEKTIATYDRRAGKESFFRYPSGLTGDKLAIEI